MSRLRRLRDVVQREADAQSLLLGVAIGLIAFSLWTVWRPGAYLVPGIILLWIVLPTRRPFIDRTPPSPPDPRKRVP